MIRFFTALATMLMGTLAPSQTVVAVYYAGATLLPQAGVLVRYGQLQDKPVTVSVAVLRDSAAVPGADVTVEIRNALGDTLVTTTALDDGDTAHGDLEANDGLYSANITGLESGFYIATATVTLP